MSEHQGEPPGGGPPAGPWAEPKLEEAVRAIQRHGLDHPSARIFFDHFSSFVYRLFRRKGFLHVEAEDLTQDTLFRVFQGIEDYRFEGSVTGWVRRIAVHTLSNHLRKRDALKRAGQEVPLDVETRGEEGGRRRERSETAVASVAQDRLERDERSHAVRRAIAEMPPRMRRYAWLRWGPEGLKYREIAELLGVTVNSVRSQLSEAKSRLRRILAPDASPDGGGGS